MVAYTRPILPHRENVFGHECSPRRLVAGNGFSGIDEDKQDNSVTTAYRGRHEQYKLLQLDRLPYCRHDQEFWHDWLTADALDESCKSVTLHCGVQRFRAKGIKPR